MKSIKLLNLLRVLLNANIVIRSPVNLSLVFPVGTLFVSSAKKDIKNNVKNVWAQSVKQFTETNYLTKL